MREFKCIFACGDMRRFLSPFVWRKEEENLELVFNAFGLICDKCEAVALDPREGRRIYQMVQQ